METIWVCLKPQNEWRPLAIVAFQTDASTKKRRPRYMILLALPDAHSCGMASLFDPLGNRLPVALYGTLCSGSHRNLFLGGSRRPSCGRVRSCHVKTSTTAVISACCRASILRGKPSRGCLQRPRANRYEVCGHRNTDVIRPFPCVCGANDLKRHSMRQPSSSRPST